MNSTNKFTMYDSRHEMVEDFGRNKRQRLPTLNPSLGNPIPLYERNDQLPDSASSINSGSDFLTKTFQNDGLTIKMGESALRYQLASGNFRGGRIIENHGYSWNRAKKALHTAHKSFLIDNDHFINVVSEAQYGLRDVAGAVKKVNRTLQSVTSGASQHTRWRGLEMHDNPTIYPKLPEGANMEDVEPNVPNQDVFRFNDMTVEQITTFPAVSF